jgi:hypothetical protein
MLLTGPGFARRIVAQPVPEAVSGIADTATAR